MWRVGRKLGRTLYLDGVCIGMLDDARVAALVVEALEMLGGRFERRRSGVVRGARGVDPEQRGQGERLLGGEPAAGRQRHA
jgi:hypothetical protein